MQAEAETDYMANIDLRSDKIMWSASSPAPTGCNAQPWRTPPGYLAPRSQRPKI